MHKAEDGKVIASLTEVKNKTGDIFALVDKFGEVSLTSYNKIRYKIVKVDFADEILNNLEVEEPKVKKSVQQAQDDKKAEKTVAPRKEEKVEVKESKPVIKETVAEEASTMQIKVWNKNSKNEVAYSKKIKMPLINSF
jgi:uncharacterized protein YqfA (UPF0365 family)